MRQELIPLKQPASRGEPLVHVDLATLVRLEYKARGFAFLPRQPVHSVLSGRYASRVRGRGLDFEELRRYLPGDDIRAMDWKATARTRKPQLRVYTEERNRPVLLVVDQRLSMFFGSRRAMKSVTAAEVAALAAWRVVSVGDRIGALVFNDTETVEIRPLRSRARVMQILQTLVEHGGRLRVGGGIRHEPGKLAEVLGRAAQVATHDHLIVVISDFSGADDATVKHLTRMARHNDVLAALIRDPLEEALPCAGRIVVSDGTRQLEVDTDDARVRERFRSDLAERLARRQRLLAGLAVPILPISTAQPVAEQIRAALGHAGVAGRGRR